MKNLIFSFSFVCAFVFGVSVQAQSFKAGPSLETQLGVIVENNSDCAYAVTLFSAHPMTAGAYCIFPIASATKVLKPGGSVNFPPVPVSFMNFNLTLIPGFVRVVDVKNSSNTLDAYLIGCNLGPFGPSGNTMPSCIQGEFVTVNAVPGGVVTIQ